MNEHFLQYLWKNKLIKTHNIRTHQGVFLQILDFGIQNHDAGPDFVNSIIEMDGIKWAGNVEIHVKASDWYKHNHHKDNNYKNIIMHVVFENDLNEKDTALSQIPVLEIKNLFDKKLFYKYRDFLLSRNWIPCESDIGKVENILIISWLNRLLAERLERKSQEINHYYKFFNNDWLETLYFFLCKNFGFKKNSVGFEMLAKSLPYKTLAKHSDQITQIEALLYGQSGLLKETFSDTYPKNLFNEYNFLRKKYNIKPINSSLWKFSRLRPPNFPTIRLSQLAQVIHLSGNLWDQMISNGDPGSIKKILFVNATDYWNNHYTFEKESPGMPKNLGESCIENILINTIAPVMFVYGKNTHRPEMCEKAFGLLSELKPEGNSIIRNWKTIGIKPVNAADSQALIELKKNYCTPKKCLECVIGSALLKQGSAP